MARNDGIDRTSVRNLAVSDNAVGNTQQHNEREKDSYRNPDIIPQRAAWNVHFKKPTASYTDLFAQLEAAGTISTRGLKPDATHYCELVFDVNSAYFDNHGGYEFAKQFYEDAYKAAVQIVGGEQYILSAVMHADEINRAMTEALGREVYHYHLHVVYVPVVEKQILWSKRCKDKALVGTVKETVMQVSRSKKWASKPLLDDAGKPVLQKSGKPVLKKSYSVLQDDFFNYMRNAGYTDVERGERGSTEEHLTVTQFKVQREQERLDSLTAQADQKVQSLAKTSQTLSKKEKELAAVQKKATLTKEALIHARDLDYIGKRTFLGNYSLTEEEFSKLKKQADHGYMMDVENRRLKEELSTAKRELAYGRRNRLIMQTTKNRKFPLGNSLLYISFLSVAFGKVRPGGRTLFFTVLHHFPRAASDTPRQHGSGSDAACSGIVPVFCAGMPYKLARKQHHFPVYCPIFAV